MTMDYTFLIAGEAGQGVQSMGYILTKALAKAGYHVFASQDYESRIRGGHNVFTVRVSDRPVRAVADAVDLVLALNVEAVRRHAPALSDRGLVLYDGERVTVDAAARLLSVPFERLAVETTRSRIMGNTVALGAALYLVGFDDAILAAVLRSTFGKKSDELAARNVDAARVGYRYAAEHHADRRVVDVTPRDAPTRMVINGTAAVALGALAAGCKFMAGYPMTPATGIMHYFVGHAAALDLIFEQAEDELAALNMVLGASYAGVRAMTATSGGGFALMVEALSLAGMTETPAIIVLAQRPGPATGLPTRTEQGELEFAVHAGHGTFPRAVFAPGTVEEAFRVTVKAFNLAERYQIPVIVLTDQHLGDSYTTTAPFDLAQVTIERGDYLTDEAIEALGTYRYQRHRITASGISPRVLPGHPGALVVTDSDEHTEDGHITESAAVRVAMVQKRLRTLEGLRSEIAPPTRYGPPDAAAVLVGWGSTYGAMREAVDRVNHDQPRLRLVHLCELWPFPRRTFAEHVQGAERFLVVESNPTGQLAHLIRAETGLTATGTILRFDGRPITPAYILQRLPAEVTG
jgi:2-oxoglutarate ferredoxin oxidoreductase subunit alpha